MITQVDLSITGLMGSLFIAYLLGVRVLEVFADKLRSIRFIKTVHTVVFVPLSALLLVFVYEVISGRISYFTWIALSVFLTETVVLATHHWRCPLTMYAERLGSTHGQITDFFFPKWFADRVFLVYGALFAASLVLLVIRMLS